MGENSFVLYDDYWEHIKLLSETERSTLLTAIFAHRGMCKMPKLENGTKIAFSFIRSQLDRDTAKYTAICERNRINGAKGGRPSKNPEYPLGYMGYVGNPNKPKKADTDNDTDTINETGLDIDYRAIREHLKCPCLKS